MKKCKNCSEETEEDLNKQGLCEDCADEAALAEELLKEDENDA